MSGIVSSGLSSGIAVEIDQSSTERLGLLGHIDVVKIDPNCEEWLELGGWIFSKADPIEGIAVYSVQAPRHPLVMVRLHERPDVSAALSIHRKTGFRTRISIDGLVAPFSLYVVPLYIDPEADEFRRAATFFDHRAVIFANIKILVSSSFPSFTYKATKAPALAPIYVTSLGRSGSTAVCRYIGSSSNVFVYDRYPIEARLSAYWLHMMRLATSPRDPLLAIGGEQFCDIPSLASTNPFLDESSYPEYNKAAAETTSAIRDAYLGVIDSQVKGLVRATGTPKSRLRFFIEKALPGTMLTAIARRHIRGTKEIVVTREPLMFCRSLFAFNRRRANVQVYTNTNTMADTANAVCRDVELLCDYVEYMRESVLIIKYEDLAKRDSTLLSRIAEYFELDDLNPAVLGDDVGFEHRSPELQMSDGGEIGSDMEKLFSAFSRRLGY